MFGLMNPRVMWEKPAENAGGDPDDVPEEEEDIAEEDGGEDEDFEAALQRDHPELYKQYIEHTQNLLSALRKERDGSKEAKKLRAQLKKYEEAAEERVRAERTEIENAQADLKKAIERADKAERELLQSRKERIILEEAGKLDFIEPSDGIKFLDMDEIDPEDRKAVEEKIKGLAKERPYLVQKKDLGKGNDTGHGKDTNLDKDPKAKKKVKEGQPKLSI